ncbi:Pecanex-like protein 1 [Frankliniella fusca]|uniref:Pecanex-like protein 1 n=1 Tax=Frankliniella fusca TaxID=407009 RepID=A0AAE1LL53_9NEOP|nr:Pecanex-like protein 1 [Frankliniella fusca]
MECSVCLELPEKRIPARHLSSTCRPRHIYATFVGECTCAMVWCVWCARKAAEYRLNQAIRAASRARGRSKDDEDAEAEMVPCPMCRAPVHPTRFFTHPRPLGGAERARLVREYRPPPCWFIWGDNVCRFGRLCRNNHAGLDGRPLQRGRPLSRQDWLARRPPPRPLPEPFHVPPSFLDRAGRAWFHTERHGYVRIVDPTSPQVWEKLNTAQRFSPMSDKHPTEALGLGALGGGLALSTGLSVGAADLDADGAAGAWRWLASAS